MIRPLTITIALACPLTTFAGDAMAPPATSGDWEFSLSVGAGWRHAGSFDFTGGTRSAGVAVPSFVGGQSLVTPPIGAGSAFDDRSYNDGFVRMDSSTTIDGLTSHWAYQDSGQVDATNDLIRFHATGFESIRNDVRTLSAAPDATHRERGIAPILRFDARHKREIGGVRPGFGALLVWNQVGFDRHWSDFSLVQTREDFRHDWSDAFNLGGFGSLVPSAPYEGMPDSPGFLLGNLPDSRDMSAVPVGLEQALISNHAITRFRADHTTLSFGPSITRSLSPQWNLEISGGASLHWLRWSAGQYEQLSATQAGTRTVIAEWNDSSSGNRVLIGGYVQIAAEWMPADQAWSLQGMLRVDRGQSMSRQIGASHFRYGVDGMTLAILWRLPL